MIVFIDKGSEDVAETIEIVESLSLESLETTKSRKKTAQDRSRSRTVSGSDGALTSSRSPSIALLVRGALARRSMTSIVKKLDQKKMSSKSSHTNQSGKIRRHSTGEVLSSSSIHGIDSRRTVDSNMHSNEIYESLTGGDVQKVRMGQLLMPFEELNNLLNDGVVPPHLKVDLITSDTKTLNTFDGIVAAIKGCMQRTNIAIVSALLQNITTYMSNNPNRLTDFQALEGGKDTDIRGAHWVAASLLTTTSTFVVDDAHVAELAVPLLCCLFHKSNVPLPANLVAFGVEYISKIMGKHCAINLSLTKFSCLFIVLICVLSNPSTVKDVICDNDFILMKDVINLCFTRHLDDEDAVMLGCHVLCCQAIDKCSRSNLVNLGVLELLNIVLDQYGLKSPDVVECVAKVLFSLSHEHSEISKLVGSMPLGQALVKYAFDPLFLVENDAQTQESEPSGIRQFENGDHEAGVNTVNVGEDTLGLSPHIARLSAASWGLRTLGSLAWHCQDNKDWLGSIGCCELAARTICSFGMINENLAMSGYFAVANLAHLHSENQARLIAAGVGEVIPQQMIQYRDSLDVIRESCIATYNLVVGSVENQERMGSETEICKIVLETFIHMVTISRLEAQENSDNACRVQYFMHYIWYALSALAVLCNNREKFSTVGISDCFVVALTFNDVLMNTWVFKCLVSFSFSDESAKNRLKLDKICTKLPAALSKSAIDMTSASDGSLCVGIIAGMDIRKRSTLTNHNAFDVIMHIFYKYEKNVTAAGCCIFALRHILCCLLLRCEWWTKSVELFTYSNFLLLSVK